MIGARFLLTSLLLISVATTGLARQSQWYALYDEAVKHIQAGEFQQAESKLLQAKKDGPASGRNVIRPLTTRTMISGELPTSVTPDVRRKNMKGLGLITRKLR